MKQFVPIAVCGVFAGAACGQAILVDTFESDDAGWRYLDTEFIDDLITPAYQPAGGNPGGYIEGTDAGNGAWYWIAPDPWNAALPGAFGGSLSFDRFSSGADGLNEGVQDLLLVGNNGVALSLDTPGTPTEQWGTTTVFFDVNVSPWFNESTQLPATQQELQAALGDVFRFGILGEYRRGADTGGLDNVIVTPAPAGVAPIGLAGVVATRRRRRPA